jgi:hypothetical protein
MKICPYCGRENGDEAGACCECGTMFAPVVDAATTEAPGAPAPARGAKIAFLASSFALAMLAMLPLGGLLFVKPFLILAFPSGLWAFFRQGHAFNASAVTAWIFYVALTTALMLARRRAWFILFYVVLCVALAMNVTGCYRIVNENLQGWK